MRLAADEGDRSWPRLCRWDILGVAGTTHLSSCGASVIPTAPMNSPEAYDYLVVVGDLLHGGQKMPDTTYAFLQEAAARDVELIGLCTGSFMLARAGFLDGHLTCVSWFHPEAFMTEFSRCVSCRTRCSWLDRDRLTCAGGTSVVHLAAEVI